MSFELQNLEYNQTFSFRDGTARFLSKDNKSNFAWIEYNGQVLKVDFNDLFGINHANEYLQEMKDEALSGINERILFARKQYNEYCLKIDEAKLTCSRETENQNFFTKAMAIILGDRKDASSLTGNKAQEYYELEVQLNASRKLSSRASSDIFSYALFAADEALYLHDLYGQRIVGEAMLG
jgi:hypothetical protein